MTAIGTGLALIVVLSVSCGSPPQPGEVDEVQAAEELETRGRDALRAATAALFEGDAEEALRTLDKTGAWRDRLPSELRGQLQLTIGKANLAFAKQRIASGGGGAVLQGSFLDAEDALQRAARDLPDDAESLCLLAETYSTQGRFDEAIESAGRALTRVREATSQGTATPALVPGLLLRAKAGIQKLAQMRQGATEEPDEATLHFANEILADLAKAKNLEPTMPEPYELASTTYRWIGRFDAAMRALEDGVRAHPHHSPHHASLQGLYLGQKRGAALVGLYRRLVRENEAASPTTIWWLGRALYDRAAELRATGDRRKADAHYRESEKAFEKSGTLQPSFRDSSDLYRALCAVSSARMALDEGDDKTAAKELDRAWAITPRIAELDERGYDRWRDSFSKTYRGALDALGSRMREAEGGLEAACRYYRKIGERHPDWGWIWNNLGLAARDLGVKTARDGDDAAAMTLYEESFRAYERAAKLSPDDARIQNDLGLMLIYHLHREQDRAISQFEKAIRIGTAQLAALPAGEDDETLALRKDYEESVGDAWGNWGLALEQKGELELAIEKYQKSLEYYPGQARDGARKIPELRSRLGKKQAAATPSPARRFASSAWLAVATCALLVTTTERALCAPPVAGDDKVADALKQIAAGDADAVLSLVERGLGKSEDPERWYCAGRGSLMFAQKLMAEGGSGAEANLIDAVDRLKKADTLTRKLDGPSKNMGTTIHIAPARYAIEAMLLRGQNDEALDFGTRHLTHVDSTGLEFAADEKADLYGQIAAAAVRVATAAYQSKDDGASKAAETARAMVTRYEKAFAKLSKEDRQTAAASAFQTFKSLATLEEWAQRGVAALRVWDRVLPLFPATSAAAAAGEIVAIASRTKSAENASEILATWLAGNKGDAATLAWYLGYAKVLRGHEQRMAGQNKEAATSYQKARKDFEIAMRKNSGFTANSKYWIGMAWAAEGAAAKSAGDAKAALDHWMEAVQTDARVALQPDTLGQSAQGGVMLEVDELYRAGKLDEAAKLATRYLEALGREDKNILNNIGFFWRDHAARLSGTARRKAYEASWAAYERAAALAQDDPRVLNDAALIDVYYLKKNLDKAERMLRRAIEVGDAKLADDPPEDEDAKNQLEEATGDAYMNLGVLLIEDEKRWDEAQKMLEKSLDFYPPRRASPRHLARLERLRREKKGDGK